MRTKIAIILATFGLVIFNMVDFGLAQNSTDLEPRALDKGMEPLYAMTNFFLGITSSGQSLAGTITDLVNITKGNLVLDWQKYASAYIGYVICVAVGILFIIIMPIVGCCFCCCRCCGKCGGKAQPMEGKRAKCQRITCGIVLAIITTLMLGGVVCAFVTNELMYSQTKAETGDKYAAVNIVQNEINSLDTYVSTTVNQLRKSTLTPYNETVAKIIDTLNAAGETTQTRLGKLTNAGPILEQANKVAKKVDVLVTDLDSMKTLTVGLNTTANELNSNLTAIKTDIESSLGDCTTKPEPGRTVCTNIKTSLGDLKTGANFGSLDSVLEAVDTAKSEVQNVTDQNITGLVSTAEQKFNNIKTKVNDEVQNGITTVKSEANKAYKTIEDGLNQVTKAITNFQLSDIAKNIDPVRKDIKAYGDYRWYAGIGLSCVLLLVVVFNYLGLAFGACGEQSGDGASYCNRGVGANLLMAGVGFSFIFCWLLMLLTLILFLAGGLTYTEVCKPLSNEEQKIAILKLVDGFIPEINISIAKAYEKCTEDKAIYEAFQVKNIYDLDQILDIDKLGITDAISSVGNVSVNTNITILPADLKTQIENLGNTDLNSIDFNSILNELNKKLVEIDLLVFANDLRNASNILNIAALNESARDLTFLQTSVVAGMMKDTEELRKAVEQVNNSVDIKNETTSLLQGIEAAQTNIQINGSTLVSETVNSTTKGVLTDVESFVANVKDEIENKIGKCGEVAISLDLMIKGVCSYVLDPFNGFWYSFGWGLFFFIPSIILAVKLAGVYRKTDKYDAELYGGVDYDDYEGVHPGDTIPLESLDSHKANGGRGESNGGYDSRNGHGDYNRGGGKGYDDYRGGYRGGQGSSYYPDSDPYLDHGRGYPGGGPPAYKAPNPPQYHSNNRYGGQKW